MGFVPSVEAAFTMSLITMLCLGSWSVALRKSPNWRFEAWYLDFAWSALVAAFLWGITLGSFDAAGWHPMTYIESIVHVPARAISLALFAGAVGGAGNYLLTAAIRLAGLAFAFPIGVGLSLVLGTMLAHFTNPSATNNPTFLFVGVSLVFLAIISNAMAHATKHAQIPSMNLKRGVVLAILSGILIALFPFPFNFAFEQGINAYNGAFYLILGALGSTLVLTPYFMSKPLIPGESVITIREYFRAKSSWHMWAIAAGIVWSTGNVFNLIVADQPKFSVAIAFTLSQCAAMIAACWGIFIFKEFRGTPKRAHYYLGAMFVLFFFGIVCIAKATG